MISTTIKKAVFNEKLRELKRDGYFIEYKPKNDFWKREY
jgi:hypothetical protein